MPIREGKRWTGGEVSGRRVSTRAFLVAKINRDENLIRWRYATSWGGKERTLREQSVFDLTSLKVKSKKHPE